MAQSKLPSTCWLDTSAVIYHLHGHTLQQQAFVQAVAGRTVEVPTFVRMEYLRGFILNLIEMYGLLKESRSVHDAFIEWSQKVGQERKLKVVLLSVTRWLAGLDDHRDKELTMRRLGDLIFRDIYRFDESFSRSSIDRLACQLGRQSITQPEFEEDHLFDYYVRFRAILEGKPECRLCTFRETQTRRLNRAKVNLVSTPIRERYASNQGFVSQLEHCAHVSTSLETEPALVGVGSSAMRSSPCKCQLRSS